MRSISHKSKNSVLSPEEVNKSVTYPGSYHPFIRFGKTYIINQFKMDMSKQNEPIIFNFELTEYLRYVRYTLQQWDYNFIWEFTSLLQRDYNFTWDFIKNSEENGNTSNHKTVQTLRKKAYRPCFIFYSF